MGALTGKAAVVTGGSRGIGRAIVRRLAGEGASVVFSYAANQQAAGSATSNFRRCTAGAPAVVAACAASEAATSLPA